MSGKRFTHAPVWTGLDGTTKELGITKQTLVLRLENWLSITGQRAYASPPKQKRNSWSSKRLSPSNATASLTPTNCPRHSMRWLQSTCSHPRAIQWTTNPSVSRSSLPATSFTASAPMASTTAASNAPPSPTITISRSPLSVDYEEVKEWRRGYESNIPRLVNEPTTVL